MKKTIRSAACGLLCIFVLAACAPEGAAPPPTPAPSDVQTPAAMPSSSPTLSPAPVSADGLAALYAADGYEVVKVTPWDEDFVVEYRESGGTNHIVDWVFHRTARRVMLDSLDEGDSYEVTGPGRVRFRTEFYRADLLCRTIPQCWEITVLADENGDRPDSGPPAETERLSLIHI